ncbi:MAG TPA: succinate dehydrogenase, cytochrome b556 subunit [Gammaproteobacteria bacterium]|nr:succinate dehydrogenase, cytochrome b556 subunit [Gammaproteobacteria bacterium]
MSSNSMPTSPHMSVYRWQITMTLSILHRLSGVVLLSAALGLVYWLVSLAMGPAAFARAHWFFSLWIGQAFLCLWSLAFFYHLLNGIRHLTWDAGYGFTKRVYRTSGWLVVVSAITLTGVAWAIGWLLAAGGAA